MDQEKSFNDQPNNPLHGVKLADLLDLLLENYGWEGLAERVNINCFKSNPTVKSSLNFLRKTPWARAKVEQVYLDMSQDKKDLIRPVLKRVTTKFKRTDL